jgi:hypothetical protein
MKLLHAALFLAASTLVVGPAVAAKKKPAEPPCIKGKVLSAFQMRMLQTELVVGALSCKMTPRYNDFVTAYKTDLMTAHKTLMAYFAKESKLEDYKSRTANEVSQRSIANIAEFCNYSTALYDKLLGTEKIQLASFAATEPAANRHDQNACDAPAVVTASSASTVSGKFSGQPRAKPDVPAAAMPAAPAVPVPAEAPAAPAAPAQN